MAYYAALVSLVELLKEINSLEHPYSKSPFGKNQIHVSLYKKLTHLQELLEGYSPKLFKEAADNCLGRRIRNAAYKAQDIIESHVSDWIRGEILAEGSAELALDNIVGNEYYDLQKVMLEVDYIVGELRWIHESVVLDEEFLMTIKYQLCGEPSRRVVISIVGMGGLGKTTLARSLFDDKLIEERFYCRAWITVSQNYHLHNILLAIVSSLKINRKELHGAGQEVLSEHIYKHLKGKRYLIIMDDVWDTKLWDGIRRIFPDDDNRSRIIVTTRLSEVASYANSWRVNHMQYLSEHQSWNLLCRKVFCPPELEDIGRLIAKNCQGLPLAIIVVAGLLSKVNETRHDWGEIARNVSRTAIAQNDGNFSKILSLSYSNLPHHLKPCFLHLGGFPEGYEIPITKIIKLWVAEGFLKPIESESLEELGEEYLQELVSRNLVLITKKRSDGKFKYCGIHDLLKAFCLQRAHYENFLLLHENDSIGNVRRLYIHSSSYFQDRGEEYVPCVRSVLFFGYSWDNIEWYLSQFKLLRILDALSMEFHIFPVEIVELFHLRYLALQCFECHIPPSISKLQNLQTLIIPGTTSLPSEIWEMPQLRHLMFSRMTLSPIPYAERIIGVPFLGMLQTLCTVVDLTFTHDIVEMIRSLKKLKIRFCNYEPHENAWEKFGLKNLHHLHQLETLDITFDGSSQNSRHFPESFAFLSTLKRLTLTGCNLRWEEMTVVGSLPYLQVLKLKYQSFVGNEWEPIEGQFPNLRFLLMASLHSLKYWRAECTHFPCLEQLHVRDCGELEEIPDEIGEIPTLQLIEVDGHNSAVELSALRIQDEQREMGNEDLQVRVVT